MQIDQIYTRLPFFLAVLYGILKSNKSNNVNNEIQCTEINKVF